MIGFHDQANHTADEIASRSGTDSRNTRELLEYLEKEGLLGSYVAGRAGKR